MALENSALNPDTSSSTSTSSLPSLSTPFPLPDRRKPVFLFLFLCLLPKPDLRIATLKAFGCSLCRREADLEEEGGSMGGESVEVDKGDSGVLKGGKLLKVTTIDRLRIFPGLVYSDNLTEI